MRYWKSRVRCRRRSADLTRGWLATGQIELFESGYQAYAWRRLLTVSAEDCWGVITHEIESLYRSWELIHKQKPGGGRIFMSKATILLAMARKCRDADHLTNLVYDPKAIDDTALEASLDEARKQPEAIPEYAFDCHTSAGKRAGKTKEMFFQEEFQSLTPREPGLFDQDVPNPNQTKRQINI